MKIWLLLCIVALCGAEDTDTKMDSIFRQASSHVMAAPAGSLLTYDVDAFISNKREIKRLYRVMEDLSNQANLGFWIGIFDDARASNDFVDSLIVFIQGDAPSLMKLATVVEGNTPDPLYSLQQAFANRLTNVMALNNSRYFLPQALKGLTGFDILLLDGGKYAVDKHPNSFLDSHAATIPPFILNNIMPLLAVFRTIRNEPSKVDILMKNLLKIDFDPLLGPQPTPTDADKIKLASAIALIRSMTQSDSSNSWHLDQYDFELIGKSRLFEFLNTWKQFYLLMSVQQS